jgi:prevent-host-death family protein
MLKRSIPEARGHIPELVEQVAAQGETVVLTMGAEPIGALVTLDDLARYQKMEAIDVMVSDAADHADPNLKLTPLEQVMAEGIRRREQYSKR